MFRKYPNIFIEEASTTTLIIKSNFRTIIHSSYYIKTKTTIDATCFFFKIKNISTVPTTSLPSFNR